MRFIRRRLYLEQRRTREPTECNDIVLAALKGAMGKIQFNRASTMPVAERLGSRTH